MQIEALGPQLDTALGPLVGGGQSLCEVSLGKQFVVDLDFGLDDYLLVNELVEMREVDLGARKFNTAGSRGGQHRDLIFIFIKEVKLSM
jgi:hypothetical protein